jgi:DNA-binding winged helix-turn-helix (wHTH) protein
MAAWPSDLRRTLRFGVFELRVADGELRKHGVRVRLQEQPLKILLTLLEARGELVSREELVRVLWPEGTFVDYERGLNTAVTRLRQTLGIPQCSRGISKLSPGEDIVSSLLYRV